MYRALITFLLCLSLVSRCRIRRERMCRADQGHRLVPGPARQPADRLRHRRRPRRHRRRQPRLFDPGHEGRRVALRPPASGRGQPRAQERRRGHADRRTAGLCQARPAARRHHLGARQGQEPAWRHADHGAAARCRRPDLRDRPGQPHRRRSRHRCRTRRLEAHDQRPDRGLRIPGGATVERSVDAGFATAPQLRFDLAEGDLTTSPSASLATSSTCEFSIRPDRACDRRDADDHHLDPPPRAPNARATMMSRIENARRSTPPMRPRASWSTPAPAPW